MSFLCFFPLSFFFLVVANFGDGQNTLSYPAVAWREKGDSCTCESIDKVPEQVSCSNCDSHEIEQKIAEITEDLLYAGLYVTMTETSFPHNTISPSSWLQRNLRHFISMEIDDHVIDSIEPDAFNKPTFSKTVRLKLSMPLKVIRSGAFNGLTSLSRLTLNNANIHAIKSSPEPQSLLQLESLDIRATNITSTLLDRFLHDFSLKNCTLAIFMENDKFTEVKKEIFSKFVSLKYLDLSHNRIAAIENGSFDAMAGTLTTLHMKGNRLTTLPVGIFPIALLSIADSIGSITLQSNPWHCSCELQYLKDIALEYPWKRLTTLTCETPPHFRNKRIRDVKLCGSESIQRRCHSLNPKTGIRPLSTRKPPSLLIEFTSSNQTLIWLENPPHDRPSGAINLPKCMKSARNESVTVDFAGKLKSNGIYTFCLMNKAKGQVYPLNCFSYHKPATTSIFSWLRKHLTPVLCISSAVCIFATGFGIVSVLAWEFIGNRRSSKKKAILSIFGQRKRCEWSPGFHSSNDYQPDLLRPPPLPPRPKYRGALPTACDSNEFDDPVYSEYVYVH